MDPHYIELLDPDPSIQITLLKKLTAEFVRYTDPNIFDLDPKECRSERKKVRLQIIFTPDPW